jgi:DNA-3-methyladenine glycosylase
VGALPSLRDPPTAGEIWPALHRSFYERPVTELAAALLGTTLLSEDDDGLTGGAIVEAEAYGGPEDRASHARAGLTRRTAPMFGPAGHAYVYLIYGLHSCVNVVGEGDATPGAVLIRALEPRIGLDLIRARRGAAAGPDARLCAGPARLCQALGVTRALDGHDLTAGARLWISGGAPDAVASSRMRPSEILTGPRIGVSYAEGDWAARPWRFGVRGSASLSRPFPREPQSA